MTYRGIPTMHAIYGLTNVSYYGDSVTGQVGSEDHAQIWELMDDGGDGVNWTKPELLFSKYGSFDRNRIILSLSGAWLYPMYYAGKSMTRSCDQIMCTLARL